MAKNKKLKIRRPTKRQVKKVSKVLKENEKSIDNKNIIVIDNSKKSIRSGDTQPKQPKPPQPPIIINNQQPYMNPYNFIPPQPSLFQSQATSQATKTTTATTTNNNVDDAINAFSKTNEDRFKTLQEQLNTMNDNFRQASRNIMERIDPQSYNKDDSVQQQSTTTTQPSINIRSIPVPPTPPTPTPKKPSKVIIIDNNENKQQLNPQYNMTGLTPSRTAIELRKTPSRTQSELAKMIEESPNTVRFSRAPVTVNNTSSSINKLPSTLPDINPPKETQLNFLDKDMEELDQMLNSISPYQTPKLTQQNNKEYSTPKLLPYNPSESSYGPSSQLDSYLRQVDKQTEKQIKADEKLSKFKQEELDALEAQTVPDTEPLEIKKPEQDESVIPTPSKYRKRIEEATGPNKEAELYSCPYCGYKSNGHFQNLLDHMETHIVNIDKDKPLKDESGNITTHRGKDVYYRKRGQNVTQTFDKSIIDYAIENKKKLKKEMFPELTQEEKTKRQQEGKAKKKEEKTNKAVVKPPANEI